MINRSDQSGEVDEFAGGFGGGGYGASSTIQSESLASLLSNSNSNTNSKRSKASASLRPTQLPKLTKGKSNLTRLRNDANQSHFIPSMPTKADEDNALIGKEFRCSFCENICDENNLECKVCFRVFHTMCLFKRGFLESLQISMNKAEWSCGDCSDLSKLLTDEEVRRLITRFDQLDVNRTGYVTYDEYMSATNKLFREDTGYAMSDEQMMHEKATYHMMDYRNAGFITWNEFCDYEVANLLTKKNKKDLSSHLTLKELIRAKSIFLSYCHIKDNNAEMITKNNANLCYLKYVDRLKKKLGPHFIYQILIQNCSELLSLHRHHEAHDAVHEVKTMWPEFIRKMTILILFDRLNSNQLKPKFCKPHATASNFTPSHRNQQHQHQQHQHQQQHKHSLVSVHNSSDRDIFYSTLLDTLPTLQLAPTTPLHPPAKKSSSTFNLAITAADSTGGDVSQAPPTAPNIEQLMLHNMELMGTWKPSFGSFKYVIRSGQSNAYNSNDTASTSSYTSSDTMATTTTSTGARTQRHLGKSLSQRHLNAPQPQPQPLPFGEFTSRSRKQIAPVADSSRIKYEYDKVTQDIQRMFGVSSNADIYSSLISIKKTSRLKQQQQHQTKFNIKLDVPNETSTVSQQIVEARSNADTRQNINNNNNNEGAASIFRDLFDTNSNRT